MRSDSETCPCGRLIYVDRSHGFQLRNADDSHLHSCPSQGTPAPEKSSLSPVQEEAPSNTLGSNESVIRTAEHGEVAARFGVIVAQSAERSAADLSGDNVGHDAQHETQLSVGESNTVMLGHGNSLEGSTLSMRNFSGNRPPDPIDPPIINDLSASMFVLMAMHDSLAEKDGVVVWWQAGRDSMTHRASAETVRQATARIAQLENELRGSISERETLTADRDSVARLCSRWMKAALDSALPPGSAAETFDPTHPEAFCSAQVRKALALIDERDEAEAAVARLTTEKAKYDADLAAAAGELLVPIPEAGTDAARMLVANRLLKSQLQASQRFREQAIQDIEALPTFRVGKAGGLPEAVSRSAVLLILREAPTNG